MKRGYPYATVWENDYKEECLDINNSLLFGQECPTVKLKMMLKLMIISLLINNELMFL